MNRRELLGGSALALVSMRAFSAAAQDATPEQEPEEPFLWDFADIRGVDQAVARFVEIPSVGLESVFSGDLLYAQCWAFQLRTDAQAKFAPREMVDAYEQWIKSGLGRRFRELERTSARGLGDESWGWSAETTAPDDNERYYPWALLAVKKETVVQILVGSSFSGSPIRQLADISENTIDRWPNEDRRYTYDDEAAGGLWDALPRLSDLEEGMVIDDSQDVTDEF